MNVRHVLAAGIAIAVLCPSIAGAQDSAREAGWDFGADIVYQLSGDAKFDGGSRLDFDDDLGLALAFGYRFTPRFELQFGIDWNTVNYHGTLQSASVPTLSANVHGDMESFTPHIDAVFNFMNGPLTPYVQGGIGWSFIDTNIPTGQVQIGCWWDPWWGQICTPYQATLSTDQLTYQAGLGVRWDFGEESTVRFSYEKTWFDLEHASSTPSWDQFKVGFVYRMPY
jgi:opacity protein-like surface antigen